MAMVPLRKRALATALLQCRTKLPCKTINALRCCASIRRRRNARRHDRVRQKLVRARATARFAWDECAGHWRPAHKRSAAAMHDLIMLHISHRCDRLVLAGAEKWQLPMTCRRRAWAAEQLAAWFGSISNWLQLVSRCGRLCAARTPRPMSTSQQRIRCAGAEVDGCLRRSRAPWAR